MPDFRELSALVRSRMPMVCIETVEEPKVLRLLERLARDENLDLHVWSVADGLAQTNFRYGPAKRVNSLFGTVERAPTEMEQTESHRRPEPETRKLENALHHIDKDAGRGLYVLLDPHPFLEDPIVIRLMREIILDHPNSERTLVLVAPTLPLTPELSRHAAHMNLRIPDMEAIRKLFRDEVDLYKHQQGESVRGEKTTANALMHQVIGLPEDDVRRLIRNAIRDDGRITDEDLARVARYKQDMLGGTALDVELSPLGPDDIGGLSALKRWLDTRRPIFTGEREAPGLPTPKGVMLLGVQGAGKSLAAKVVAGSWKVPLLRLDVASLYDKYTGETERKLREALRTAEAMAPAVLWIDEIEKALASGSSEGDGGVSRRLLGHMLTWMAEQKARLFIVATANDVSALPPELLRKGRFDEIFFVDLPSPEVRKIILAIHLKRRDLKPDDFDLDTLALVTDGYSGAELEQLVVAGMYESLADGEPLDTDRLVSEAGRTRPLSHVMSDKVAELRCWASERCVAAD
ncbi:AAA family ATPase [Nitrogeniibacter aestuarii]|uniref:AAA family ATPase n=1 Tax=Nitrogeniibacter aestuarii TaxID=2815343 RepID=UPI001E5084D2|nr:AAA family ATPase [Nitrogeniibacter aestuarii]